VSALPPVFNGRLAERLAAESEARQEAHERFLEAVYGLVLDNRTDIWDVAHASPTLDTSLRKGFGGVKETDRTYFDDGHVRIVLVTTLHDVLAAVRKDCEGIPQDEQLVSPETIQNLKRQVPDTEIRSFGLPRSLAARGLSGFGPCERPTSTATSE